MTRRVLLTVALFVVFVSHTRATIAITDTFEYTVNRNDADKSAFTSTGMWDGVKSEPAAAGSALGYLYTVTTAGIEGDCGASLPTPGSRVLMNEARPTTGGGQTDHYLQLGTGTHPTANIPASAWIQFWVCNIDSGAQQSDRLNRNKFLYVCNGQFGCHTHYWMIGDTNCNLWPPYDETSCEENVPGPEFRFTIASAEGWSNMSSSAMGVDPFSSTTLGFNVVDRPVETNTWTLVKMHLDTSTNTPRARMWLREVGEEFQLVMDHQHGVNSLSWIYDHNTGPPVHMGDPENPEEPGGHVTLKMPSTVGHASDPMLAFDYYMAMDDFTIADTEGDLPTYADGVSPSNPVRLRRLFRVAALLDGLDRRLVEWRLSGGR